MGIQHVVTRSNPDLLTIVFVTFFNILIRVHQSSLVKVPLKELWGFVESSNGNGNSCSEGRVAERVSTFQDLLGASVIASTKFHRCLRIWSVVWPVIYFGCERCSDFRDAQSSKPEASRVVSPLPHQIWRAACAHNGSSSILDQTTNSCTSAPTTCRQCFSRCVNCMNVHVDSV